MVVMIFKVFCPPQQKILPRAVGLRGVGEAIYQQNVAQNIHDRAFQNCELNI